MPQTTGFTVWLTGMSLAGKSTLAHHLAERLRAAGRRAELVDADELVAVLAERVGTNKEERNVVTRRLGYLAKVLTRNDCVALVANVSPYRETRDGLRKEIGRFIEVFVDCPTEKLMERDTTGRYKKALAGELPNFVGVTDPYETPQHAEATVRTDLETIEESAGRIFQSLFDIGYLKPDEMEVIVGKRVRRSRGKQTKEPPPPPKIQAARPSKPTAASPAPAKPAKAAPAKLAKAPPAKPAKAPPAKPAKAPPAKQAKGAPAKQAKAAPTKPVQKPAPAKAAKPAPAQRARTAKAAAKPSKAEKPKAKAAKPKLSARPAPKAAKPVAKKVRGR